MSPSAVRRHLATVLFLDIVGSTAIASELGDARWRVVLAHFRQIVRRQLKRHNGREQDTAGDGFFATFVEPVQALHCAAAITAAVQELGLDVRAGVHTGECEEIDGKLGGIAVHLAARIMSLAGAAEVMATGTAKDLVVGSTATFEDRGTCELKGIDGRWSLYRLRSIEVELPPPLDPDIAAARLSTVVEDAHRRPWRPITAAALAVAIAAVGAIVIAGHVGGASAPATLLRIDAHTNRIVSEVRDEQFGCPNGPILWAVDGTLWERTGTCGTIAIRSLATGKVLRTLPLPSRLAGFTIGYGALWLIDPGPPTSTLERVDELSGRVVTRIPLHGEAQFGAIATGDGSIWILEQDGTLVRIDPAANHVSGRFKTGASETYFFAVGAGYAWICECEFNHILRRYDARTQRAKTFKGLNPLTPPPAISNPRMHFHTWLVGLDRHNGMLWFMNGFNGTLYPRDPRTGEQTASSVGLDGDPNQAVLAHRTIWVAAGDVVDRVSLTSVDRETIALPKGTYAGGIAADPNTNTVWVANTAVPE